jgi:hypothetical protein
MVIDARCLGEVGHCSAKCCPGDDTTWSCRSHRPNATTRDAAQSCAPEMATSSSNGTFCPVSPDVVWAHRVACGGPAPPSDYRAFRRSYRWLRLYGLWALAIVGTALTLVGLFADRPGEVAVTPIGFGSAMLVRGVLLPRLGGSVELGPSGVKGTIESMPEGLRLVDVPCKESRGNSRADT